jgi:Arc/MetJ family transcription regulator
MRTTLTIDDQLLEQAQKISGLTDRTQLLREALLALVQRESAHRLAQLGGFEPQLVEPEVRKILQSTLAAEESPTNGLAFAMRIHERFRGLNVDEIPEPDRPVPDAQ